MAESNIVFRFFAFIKIRICVNIFSPVVLNFSIVQSWEDGHAKGARAKDGDRVLYRDNWRFDHDFLSLKNLSSLDKHERIVANVRLSCLNFTSEISLKTVGESCWFIKKKVRSNLLPVNFSSLHNINNNYISLSEGQPSSWCSSWWRLYWGMVFDFFRQYNLSKKRKLILSLNEWMV